MLQVLTQGPSQLAWSLFSILHLSTQQMQTSDLALLHYNTVNVLCDHHHD